MNGPRGIRIATKLESNAAHPTPRCPVSATSPDTVAWTPRQATPWLHFCLHHAPHVTESSVSQEPFVKNLSQWQRLWLRWCVCACGRGPQIVLVTHAWPTQKCIQPNCGLLKNEYNPTVSGTIPNRD
jgi:hypothetical protein